jgi:hypothetical protein
MTEVKLLFVATNVAVQVLTAQGTRPTVWDP